MNIAKIAKNAIPVNGIAPNRGHSGNGAVYLGAVKIGDGLVVARLIVEEGSGILDGVDILYAIKKEDIPTPASPKEPPTLGDAPQPALRVSNISQKASSVNISIEDYLSLVNGTEMGSSVLSLDVHRALGTSRKNDRRITPYLLHSAKDFVDDIISDTTDDITEMPELHFSMKDTTPADLTAVQEENESLNSALRLTEKFTKLAA